MIAGLEKRLWLAWREKKRRFDQWALYPVLLIAQSVY